MNAFMTELRGTLVPDWQGKDGPLPPLLVTMTFVTGLVDAFSYLTLGHVFVANMTGNVVFVGFALAGASGFSVAASLVAMVAFIGGSVVAGRIGLRFTTDRARLLGVAAGAQSVLVAVSIVLAEFATRPFGADYRYPLVVLLGATMGIQNAVARQLAVADLTTTVLTMTLTGLGADSAIGAGKGAHFARRFVAVLMMLLGALVGALCVVHLRPADSIIIAGVLFAAIALVLTALGRRHPRWNHSD